MEQTLPPNAAPPARGFDLASRLRAAGLHLALSASVALLAAALVFFVWYPMPSREARADELAAYVARTGRTAEQLGYLPLVARRSDWVALIDKASGQIAGYAPFDGF